jgi:pyrimidine-nucleoside phosphorylase
MTAYEIISKKRDGLSLTDDEIKFFINDFVTGDIPEYQMSAFLMAIYFQGMSSSEITALTQAYIHSGQVIDLSHISGKKVDKHSTGGVGDKVSIIIAPIVAAAGGCVPMISGRGLGHTGGTLDKLESIPGFKIDYDVETFIKKLANIGTCLIGQTSELAPADKKIYALRDVTATVPSVPLIAASIMSKKIAEGIDALVLDVKVGSGAFMPDKNSARELAKTLIRIGEDNGKTTIAYLTDMMHPLGKAVGNWLEIEECIECLKGKQTGPLMDLSHQLAGAMIYLAGRTNDIEQGIEISKNMVADGSAWKKFLEITESQEGDISYLEHPRKYPKAKYSKTFSATSTGWLDNIDALEVGLCSVQLGAGRQKVTDRIDPSAGIIFHVQRGEKVQKGAPVFSIYTNKENTLDIIFKRLEKAVHISATEMSTSPIILDYLDKNDLD